MKHVNPHCFTNPTFDAALRNEKRNAYKSSVGRVFPKAYICSPLRAESEEETAENAANAVRYCRFAVNSGYLPICPHVFYPQFLNDSNDRDREIGIIMGLQELYYCREIWIFGEKITEGMKREIAFAEKTCITIVRYNDKCQKIEGDKI
jgi:hypothetical protein